LEFTLGQYLNDEREFAAVMTLSEFLSLISFTTPFGCCLRMGWKANRGSGILVGLLIGVVLDVASFWGVRFVCKWAAHHPKPATQIPGWLVAAALLVWIFGFTFLGMWLTEFIIHDVAA